MSKQQQLVEQSQTAASPYNAHWLLRLLRGRGVHSDLSPNIRHAIDQHDRYSEILIKIAQLVIVMIWAVLYAIAPKTNFGTDFSPVPWALAVYFMLNVIGLIWAQRLGLPNWAVYISIIFDMSVLMLLIWSFHIQYDQPPSFYLKAPTMLYVFIFIALRALRFQARFVVFAGFAAAAGWLVLVIYAVYSAEGMSATRDYIEYLTGNEILIGAEFDKIITMIMVAGIIAVALTRANDLLIKATTDAQAASNLSRYFDSNIASDIRNADEVHRPGSGQRIDAAIMNVDLRGFTTYASGKDAEHVLSLLIAYQKRIVRIISDHGGSIDKFMGDGIMATFGAVRPSETYVADALRAIDAIVAETDTWKKDTSLASFAGAKVNMAVSSGPIVFGTIGDDDRLEFTVIGPPANVSAKLEKHNKVLKTRALVDEETYKAGLQQGYEPNGKKPAKRANISGISKVVVMA